MNLNNNTDSESVNFNDEALLAAYNGDMEVLDKLHKDGHNLGVVDTYGRTTAYLAVLNGHEDCLRFLKKLAVTLVRQTMVSPLYS